MMDKELAARLEKIEKQVGELVSYKKALVAKETARTSLENEFMEINTLDTFMKVKANTFGIGKVLFSFVKFDKNTNKLLSNTDYYMDMDDALLFANDILSGRIPQLAEIEKAKGDKYPKAIWTSKLGGKNEEKANRADGMALSRMFNLAPGSRQPFVFTAEERPGKTDEKGLIQPVYSGAPEVQIRVACSADDLKKLAISIQSNINAYRAAQYANGTFEKRY
jgi:hypothetical protein